MSLNGDVAVFSQPGSEVVKQIKVICNESFNVLMVWF